MGEKKNKKNNEGEQKKDGDDDVTVVLKTDLHCEGCAFKVIKCLRSFRGVDTATVGDGHKVTVVGQIDPINIREKLEAKTHKKIELISPQIKKLEHSENNSDGKENGNNNNKNNKANSKGKENSPKDKSKHKEENKKEKKDKKKKESKDSPSKDKPAEPDNDNKSKEKELPITTAVFKVHLHCDGCVHKIYKTVTKTKGYEDIKFDHQKDLVTVKGAMDMKALAEILQKQLKKDVQITQPAEKEGENKGKEKEGDNENGGEGENNDEKLDANNLVRAHQIGYPNPASPFMYGSDPFLFNPYTVGSYHAPQMFSDENPNACSVM